MARAVPSWVRRRRHGFVSLALAFKLLDPIALPEGSRDLHPALLTEDGLGRLFLLDRGTPTCLRLDRDGAWIQFGLSDQGGPFGAHIVAIDARVGPFFRALDPVREEIHQFDLDGHYLGATRYGPALRAAELGIVEPADFAVTRDGQTVLLDHAGGRALLFDRGGVYLDDLLAGSLGSGRPRAPTRLALTERDDLAVLDPESERVFRATRQGAGLPSWRYDEGLSPDASPGAFLAALAGGRLVVAAADLGWFRLFSTDGELLLHTEFPPLALGPAEALVARSDSTLLAVRRNTREITRIAWISSGNAPGR